MKKAILISISILILAVILVFVGFYLQAKNTSYNFYNGEVEYQATSTAGQEENNQEENNLVIKTLKIETLVEGSGAEAKAGDNIRVDYVGTLEDGTKFDSSYDRGMPLVFTLGSGRVIQGWEQGILGMKVGEKRKLTIPSGLAYGAAGIPGVIPPNATLIFEVELLGTNQ